MKNLVITISLFILVISQTYAQKKTQNSSSYNSQTVCLSADENKLYELIMQYRASKGLAKIPLSPSLTFVAQTHCKDMTANPPVAPCNMHSWSNKGTWKACCYTPDHKQAAGMWSKPQELTSYQGNGYEISHGASGYSPTPASALEGWKNSSGHNAVMINAGIWKSTWNAIGIGMVGGYAVVWFGNEKDEAVEIKVCK